MIKISKRTLNNCSLIKQCVKKNIGKPNQYDGVCEGYSIEDGGEPISICKECILNKDYEI